MTCLAKRIEDEMYLRLLLRLSRRKNSRISSVEGMGLVQSVEIMSLFLSSIRLSGLT